MTPADKIGAEVSIYGNARGRLYTTYTRPHSFLTSAISLYRLLAYFFYSLSSCFVQVVRTLLHLVRTVKEPASHRRHVMTLVDDILQVRVHE